MLKSLVQIQDQITGYTCNMTPADDVTSIRDLQERYNYVDEDNVYYPFKPDSLSERIREGLGLEVDIPVVNRGNITLGSGKAMYVDDVYGYTYDAMENYNNFVTNVLLRGQAYVEDGPGSEDY